MSPEQVQGLPVDARTDLFALGTILHEMATGRRAFEATTQASLIAKILETEPPVVSSLAPLTPPALDHVVQSCLAKAPADRGRRRTTSNCNCSGSRRKAGTSTRRRRPLCRENARRGCPGWSLLPLPRSPRPRSCGRHGR
ncbi:MAG: hypothetical protein JJE40_03330 [Vicinamibacteria bacterium]|nr:hypothetical protein [Vicinamibacteria bacterium]